MTQISRMAGLTASAFNRVSIPALQQSWS